LNPGGGFRHASGMDRRDLQRLILLVSNRQFSR
jgi:hypothetical protein